MRTLRLACVGWGCLLLVAALVTGQEGLKLPSAKRQQLEKLAEAKVSEAEEAEVDNDFDKARAARQVVLDVKTQLYGKEDWRVTDARLELANVEILARLPIDQRQTLREAAKLNGQGGNFTTVANIVRPNLSTEECWPSAKKY